MTRRVQLLRSIVAKSLLVVGSVFVGLLICEVLVRLFLPQDLIVPMPAQADEELIYRLPPNTRAYLKGTSTEWFHLETNSLGLRDSEHSPDTPAGTYRILLLGDSMSMAEGVEIEEIYLKQFESLANSACGDLLKIETINGAIRGYGNDQQVVLYERLGARFQPDLVILAFYEGNDFDDNRRGGIFRLDGDSLVRTIPRPENSPKLRYYSRQIRIQNLPGYRLLVGHSHLANLVRARIAGALIRQSYGDDDSDSSVTGVRDEDWLLTTRILEHWATLTRQAGSIPVLLFIPTDATIAGSEPLEPGPNINDRLQAFAQRTGINWISVVERLRQPTTGEALFLADGHMSPEGHRETADELLRNLVEITPLRRCGDRVRAGHQRDH